MKRKAVKRRTRRVAELELVRVKEGIDFKKLEPMFVLEARLSADRPWLLVTDGDAWRFHRTMAAAQKEAEALQKRIARKKF